MPQRARLSPAQHDDDASGGKRARESRGGARLDAARSGDDKEAAAGNSPPGVGEAEEVGVRVWMDECAGCRL